MNSTEHLLTCLIEECAEIQQAATKALRFGLSSCAPLSNITNAEQMVMEFVDMLAIFEMLLEEKMLEWQGVESSEKALIEKKEKVIRYMGYAGISMSDYREIPGTEGEKTVSVDDDDDPCQPCHNALCCLAATESGYVTKCIHYGYFKKYYASGLKKIVGAELLDDGPGEGTE